MPAPLGSPSAQWPVPPELATKPTRLVLIKDADADWAVAEATTEKPDGFFRLDETGALVADPDATAGLRAVLVGTDIIVY
jgi:hypothetical protein